MIYTPATLEDAEALAPHLKQQDIVELWEGHRTAPLPALRRSVEASDTAFTASEDGEVVAIFGVVSYSLLDGNGVVWMLSRDLKPHIRTLVKDAPLLLRLISTNYTHIGNYVSAENEPAIRLLLRLGFEIQPAVPYGVANKPFHPFTVRVSKLCVPVS